MFGPPQHLRQQIMRNHITMLGRHYATGHPSVSKGNSSDSAEQARFEKAYSDVIEFGAWFERHMEKILFLPPEFGADLFKSYIWVWETIYDDAQAKYGLQRLREVRDKWKNLTLSLKADRKRNANKNLSMITSRLSQGRNVTQSMQQPALSKDSIVHCAKCSEVIKDISSSKRCSECNGIFHGQYGGCFGYGDEGICQTCRDTESKRKSSLHHHQSQRTGGCVAFIMMGLLALMIPWLAANGAPGGMVVLMALAYAAILIAIVIGFFYHSSKIGKYK